MACKPQRVADRWVKASAQYVYHVTLVRNLESIQHGGIRPSTKSNFSSAYDSHSKGRVFLSSWSVVDHWYDKIFNVAEQQTDWTSESDFGYVPVVLRVDAEGLLEMMEDEVGNSETGDRDSWYVDSTVPTDIIDVWDGDSWVSIEGADEYEIRSVAFNNAVMEGDSPDDIYYYPERGSLMPPRG